MRNKGAMPSDAQIREGFVQGSIASGIEKAGENPNGSASLLLWEWVRDLILPEAL